MTYGGEEANFLTGVHLGHRTPFPRETIFKLARALVIKKKLDLAHLELEFISTTAAEANLDSGLKARSLPEVDDCCFSVPACFGP
jgi:hypothetical protein